MKLLRLLTSGLRLPASGFRPLAPGLRLLTFLLCVALLAGCAKTPAPPPPPADQPPHGGTLVEFAAGIYHLELLLDPAEGRLTAWFLDSELEQYIRAGAPSFRLEATVGGRDETLEFQPVASLATGETATDTSQYEARAEWLKTTKVFDATLEGLTVHGTTYPEVKFNFPKGNDSG
jgi:hypothetical protein